MSFLRKSISGRCFKVETVGIDGLPAVPLPQDRPGHELLLRPAPVLPAPGDRGAAVRQDLRVPLEEPMKRNRSVIINCKACNYPLIRAIEIPLSGTLSGC